MQGKWTLPPLAQPGVPKAAESYTGGLHQIPLPNIQPGLLPPMLTLGLAMRLALAIETLVNGKKQSLDKRLQTVSSAALL